MPESREPALFEAQFDPKWRTYFFLRILFFMVITIAGIVLIPFWILGWGQWYCKRYYDSLRCVLHERSLVVARGIFFRREMTIPLDKIQDLTLVEGPLLQAFGICRLKLVTAGRTPEGGSQADLVGVVEARSLRDRVLDQRDLVTGRSGPLPAGSEATMDGSETGKLLVEIRDSLGRIEDLLGDGPEPIN